MPKFFISSDERYPDLYISEVEYPYQERYIVEIPPELMQRWKAAVEEYDSVQDELDALRRYS